MNERSGMFMRGRLRIVVAMAVCLTAIVALPAYAYAATFANEYPLGTIHTQPQIIGVNAFSPVALRTGSARITIDGASVTTYLTNVGSVTGSWVSTETLVDGVWTIHWTWVPSAADPTKATLYAYQGGFSDGSHDVAATVTDVTGQVSTANWAFTVQAAPTFGAPTPANGASVVTTSPLIKIPVSDNGSVASVVATINGAGATANLAGGVVSVTVPSGGLPDGAVTTVTVAATDDSGNRSSRTWSFSVRTADAGTAACITCHADWRTFHPDWPNCTLCHSDLLNPDGTVKPHGFDPVTHEAAVALCETSGCHTGTAPALHPTLGCNTCHTGAGTITACNAVGCHGDKIDGNGAVISHGFDPALHIGNDVSLLPNDTKGCTNKVGRQDGCHDITNIATLHAGAPGGACNVCHTPGGRTASTYCRSCHPKGYTDSDKANGVLAGGWAYHHFNAKYLNDPTDRPLGAYYWWTDGVPYMEQTEAPNFPEHGTNDALYGQDCMEMCHKDFGQDPVPPASGSKMWYSLGSADPYPAAQSPARTLTRSVTLPAESTTLTFKAKWALEYFDSVLNMDTGATEWVLVGTDSAVVQVSADGGTTWNPLAGDMGGAGNPVTGTSNGWADGSFNLSAYAGQTIQLRFLYAPVWRANADVPADGWAIDDISITGASGTVFSDGAETLAPGWTNVGGGWDRRGATFF